MNNTKIVAICAVIILIAVSSFVVINANDKTENDYNPDIPDSEYYPVTIQTEHPGTKEMVEVTFVERPKNVIVLEETALELMMILGLEDSVSKAFVRENYVLTNPHLSEQFKKVDKINKNEMSFERIVALDPDMLMGWRSNFGTADGGSSAAGTWDYWEKRDVNIYVVNKPGNTLEEVFNHIESVGKIFNAQSSAQKYVDSFNKSIEDIKKKTEGLENSKKPKVLALELQGNGTMYIYGTSHITGILMELAGGSSVFSGGGVVKISFEEVVKMAPDMILLVVSSAYAEDRIKQLYAIEGFNSIPAIENKNVVHYSLAEIYWAGCLPIDILDRLYADFYTKDK